MKLFFLFKKRRRNGMKNWINRVLIWSWRIRCWTLNKSTKETKKWSIKKIMAVIFLTSLGLFFFVKLYISLRHTENLFFRNGTMKNVHIEEITANGDLILKQAESMILAPNDSLVLNFSSANKNLLVVKSSFGDGEISKVIRCEFRGNRNFCIAEIYLLNGGLNCHPCEN